MSHRAITIVVHRIALEVGSCSTIAVEDTDLIIDDIRIVVGTGMCSFS